MDRDALQKAIDACAINDIYLRRTSVVLDDNYDPTQHRPTINVQYKISAARCEVADLKNAPGRHSFRVQVDAGLRYLDSTESEDAEARPPTVLAELDATFIAQYLIVDDELPARECLDEFARLNAPYHVWPYWREYAQSLCVRHKLPHVVLPMLTVGMLERDAAKIS